MKSSDKNGTDPVVKDFALPLIIVDEKTNLFFFDFLGTTFIRTVFA